MKVRSGVGARRFPQPGQVLGHRAELRVRRRAPDQRGGRALQQDAEGAGDPRPHLQKYRGGARRRHRVQGAL